MVTCINEAFLFTTIRGRFFVLQLSLGLFADFVHAKISLNNHHHYGTWLVIRITLGK